MGQWQLARSRQAVVDVTGCWTLRTLNFQASPSKATKRKLSNANAGDSGMASIHAVPPELLLEIATHLTCVPETAEADLSALARTTRHLHALADSFLYRHVVKNHTFYLLHWAAEHDNLGALKKALAAGADLGRM